MATSRIKLNDLLIAHLNTRSLFSGFDEFCSLVTTYDYDIIAVTETWMTDALSSDIVGMNGYKFIRKDRGKGSRGGGVAFYVKNHINFKMVTLDVENTDTIENLWIEISIGKFSLMLGVIYRVPNFSLNQSINIFDEMLSHISASNQYVIVLGDMNINMFNLDNYVSACFDSYGFIQIIKDATRITHQSVTLLDPIFVSNNITVNNSGTVNADLISDHHLVFCNIKVPPFKIKQKIVDFRDFKNFNEDMFFIDLNNIRWDEVFYIPDLDQKIEFLTNNILKLFDTHAPLRTVRIGKPRAPWLTDVIRLMMKLRDRALKKYKLEKTPQNWSYYKNLRNFVLASIRREKQAYIISLQNNPKEMWKALKELHIQREDNKYHMPDATELEELNNYFASVFSKTDNCLFSTVHYNNTRYNSTSFSLSMVDTKCVLKAVKEIKSNAFGSDKISLIMIKLCLPTILPHLTHIVNSCMERGYFPLVWKEAEILPIPKVQNPTALKDFRPISLLSLLSKILEKVTFWQINDYFQKNNIIPKHQSGFRLAHSTTTALLNLTDYILRAADERKAAVLIALDFSKAFDTIDHELLCAKLHYYGFDQMSLSFFRSYLNGRTQRVKIGHEVSQSKAVQSGVPQGSVLGPLLFTVYTSDMFRCVNYCHIQAYADDTQIVHTFDYTDPLCVSWIINSDLEKIHKYSSDHNLKLNPTKSVMLLFCSESKRNYLKEQLSIKLNGQALQFSSSARNLGVELDDKLRFADHVAKICQKTYLVLKNLYSNKFVLSTNIKKKLCETLILPIINYCSIVYYSCLDNIAKGRLQRIQNTCCRFIFNLRKYDHITQSFNELKWLKLHNLVRFHFLLFIHKLLTGNEPSYLREKLIFRSSVHECNIRQKQMLTLPHFSTAMFQRSFTYNAVTLFNSLDNSYKSLNLRLFSKQVKELLILS